MDVAQRLFQYREIVLGKLVKGQDREEWVRTILMMIVGMIWGLYNPHQMAQELGVSPKEMYAALKQLSAGQWRRMLERIMEETALERLREYAEASAAGKSRRQASLSVDDSVVRRYGREVLSYVWKWYSGQSKSVVLGQDLLGIVVRIGPEIIPLRLVWVSKQGRASGKPAALKKALSDLKTYFEGHGIDLTQLGLSLDSWWASHPVSEELAALGFTKQVIAGKANLILETEDAGRHRLDAHRKQVELKPGWGHHTPANRLVGDNPTFGRLPVVFVIHPRSKVFALLLPARPLRRCEALRIWAAHHAIETLWKRLKQWLGLGQMQARDCQGAWAGLALHTLAYLFALPFLTSNHTTLAQLAHTWHRQATFAEFVREHFHPDQFGCPSI